MGLPSYLYDVIADLVNDFFENNDIREYEAKIFALIQREKGVQGIKGRLHSYLCPAYYYKKEYDNTWRSLKLNIEYIQSFMPRTCYLSLSDVVNILAKCTEENLKCEDIFLLMGSRWNATGFSNVLKNVMFEKIDTFLVNFKEQHNKDYITHLWKNYDNIEKSINTTLALPDDINCTELMNIPKEKWHTPFYRYGNVKSVSLAGLRIDYKYTKVMQKYISENWKEVSIFSTILIERDLRTLIRNCENEARDYLGLPRIGEGWLSETILYYEISSAFPNAVIEQHAKPKFIGAQHLDIYFPEWKVAIEYQGAQHDMPITYFGGEEAYKKNVKRDERKKALCQKNNVSLIFVRPGYIIDDVICEVQNSLEHNSIEHKIDWTSLKNIDYDGIANRLRQKRENAEIFKNELNPVL